MTAEQLALLKSLPHAFDDGVFEAKYPDLIRDGIVSVHPSNGAMSVVTLTEAGKNLTA